MLRDLLADEHGMRSVFWQTQGFQISLNHFFLLEGKCSYIYNFYIDMLIEMLQKLKFVYQYLGVYF